MIPVIKRAVCRPVLQSPERCSIPAEVGISLPLISVVPPNPLTHPVTISNSAGLDITPLTPENDSTLALTHPPE